MGIDKQIKIPIVYSEVKKQQSDLESIHNVREQFLNTVKTRQSELNQMGAFPMIGHFSQLENFSMMVESSNNPEFGEDAFRIRTVEALETLNILPKKGWGQGEGEISFYRNCQEMHQSPSDLSSLPSVENWEKSPKVVSSSDKNSRPCFYVVTPWYTTIRENVENYYGKGGKEGANQKSNGSRELLMVPSEETLFSRESSIKNGLKIVDQDIQIIILDDNREIVENQLSTITDPNLREKVRKQIIFANNDQANQIGERIGSNTYWTKYVKWMTDNHGIDQDKLLETAAIMSLITPDDGDSNQFFKHKPHFIDGTNREKLFLLDPVSNRSDFLYMSNQVMKSFYVENILYPTAEEFFDRSLKILNIDYIESDYQKLNHEKQYRNFSERLYDTFTSVKLKNKITLGTNNFSFASKKGMMDLSDSTSGLLINNVKFNFDNKNIKQNVEIKFNESGETSINFNKDEIQKERTVSRRSSLTKNGMNNQINIIP